MTRLKPIRLSPKAMDAPSVLTVVITEYEIHLGTTREGESFEEDRIYFRYDNLPMFTRLNQSSMMVLSHKGFDLTAEGLAKELVGQKIQLTLQEGEMPWYLITRVYKK